jgi:hypothetical protein
MTNFLQNLKNAMLDYEKRAGFRNQIVVDTRSLRELLHHFERYESADRAMFEDAHVRLEHKLFNILTAMYKNHHDVDRVMLQVMKILTPLIEERLKELEVDRICDRSKLSTTSGLSLTVW